MALRARGAQPSQDQDFRQVAGAGRNAISDTTHMEGLSALGSSLLLLRAPSLIFPRQPLIGPFLCERVANLRILEEERDPVSDGRRQDFTGSHPIPPHRTLRARANIPERLPALDLAFAAISCGQGTAPT
jgi:hypothetical protein